MTENKPNRTTGKVNYTGVGAAIGLIFGGVIGFLVGNPIIFAGGTMVLGLAMGAALDRRNQEE